METKTAEWKEFEDYICKIYRNILNIHDENILVEKRVLKTGHSGAIYEFDMFYEFEKAGLQHRVAVECKYHEKPIGRNYLSEFAARVADVGNTIGVIISKSGFQSGVFELAKYYGIELITPEKLPTFPELLRKRLITVALPKEDYIGEPFWIIMEHVGGNVTGTYYGIETVNNEKTIPLMFSKVHAQYFMDEFHIAKDRWAIRGLPKYAFRAFLVQLEIFEKRGVSAAISFYQPGTKEKSANLKISRKHLVEEFYGEEIPSVFKSSSG